MGSLGPALRLPPPLTLAWRKGCSCNHQASAALPFLCLIFPEQRSPHKPHHPINAIRSSQVEEFMSRVSDWEKLPPCKHLKLNFLP